MSDTPKTARAAAAIDASEILDYLAEFQPTVVSTIFAGFDTEYSDIDVVCSYAEQGRFVESVGEFVRRFAQGTYDVRGQERGGQPTPVHRRCRAAVLGPPFTAGYVWTIDACFYPR